MMTLLEKENHWLRSALEQRSVIQAEMPDWVPSRIRLHEDVRGDFPVSHMTVIVAGDYECSCNRWGAVIVQAPDGKPFGIKPHECQILAMKPNGLKTLMAKEAAESAEGSQA